MAAYAALVSLMNDLEVIPNHPTHSFSFDTTQIASLSQTVHFLVDFMESYDSHGCNRESAEALESRIASAAHAAHDVIESHVVDQIHAGSTLGGKSRCYFLLDLQKAIDDINYVMRKAVQFQAQSGLKTEQPTYSAPTSSKPLKNHMVGFDALVFQLLEILTGEPSSQQAIPIVGMGGMGKTTLARNVYEHLLIEQHFDVLVWATISQKYSVENILTKLLFGERKSTSGGNDNGLGEELHENDNGFGEEFHGNDNRLGEKLHKKLWGRRYLIVLDDIWSLEAWNEIHMFLPDNSNGSRVIVTTRLSNLAAHLSSSPFRMKFLDEDISWELFCENAFGDEDCPVELDEIGKKIVRRCRGLPLSIIVMGGHLRRSSRAIECWEKVANNMNPLSSLEDDDQCLDIISLSYHHLPAYLKPCILYMGIFEEDKWICASELLELWVVEGFVKAKKGVSLEEVAEDYLKDLVDRNLILVRQRRWNGKVEYCGIHDVVRELCLKVGKKDKFMCTLQDTTQAIDIQRERRIVIPEGKRLNFDMVGALESAPLLRSLIRQRGQFYFDLFSVDLRLLRLSANVNSMYLKNGDRYFPRARIHQVNLRYLAFHLHSAELPFSIPSSISLLWNLQTLTIQNDGKQSTAPYEIWDMLQLRHLELHGFCLPDPVPGERSNQQEGVVLQNLHSLLGVENLRLTEEVCKRMPNIKVLYLLYNHFPGASSYYCSHNLGRFDKLESLKCVFGVDSKWCQVVRSFRFPSSVEELCLWNCHLDWEDLTMMIKCMPYLGVLELDSVQGLEWNLDEEEFPSLKILRIDCYDLLCWNASSSHFPVLEILDIRRAPQLNEIPFDFGEISTLKLIQLRRCSITVAVSAVRIVMEQESFGNYDLQLGVSFTQLKELEILGLKSNKIKAS